MAASAASTYLLALVPHAPEELGAGYFLCYPLTAAGLWLVAKRLRPWSSTRILDTGIVLIGIAQLNWIFVLYPLLHRSGLEPVHAWSVSLIAVCDLVTIALLLRFAMAVRRSPVALLLLASIGVMVSSDAFYIVKYVAGRGTAVISSFSAVGWLVWTCCSRRRRCTPTPRALCGAPAGAEPITVPRSAPSSPWRCSAPACWWPTWSCAAASTRGGTRWCPRCSPAP
ncbi:hypothetical protein GCM10020218_059670 [Dactylosporangium vinaceum]